MYIQNSLEINNIELEGCIHLVNANWKNLTSISLCKPYTNSDGNKIGIEGSARLVEADWKNLTHLKLCTKAIKSDLVNLRA